MRLPSWGVPLPSLESTTSSPMSTPVKRADEAKMSSRWSSSSAARGAILPLLAAACVPSSSSALIWLRVVSTSEPSPMRASTCGSTSVTSAASLPPASVLPPPRKPRALVRTEASRLPTRAGARDAIAAARRAASDGEQRGHKYVRVSNIVLTYDAAFNTAFITVFGVPLGTAIPFGTATLLARLK